ncbi:tumor necrosis factor receptor superfamily member 1B-like isoform X2 [Myxocyprinus asiaticus]|uniref:tumor necrosis factor receptor superfamily member 1B-like isoform X2 n=1 Tax=Myxocyprinus asiaticus TaxID=70543 RepID=UPI002222C79A|nr:tumor necrosis factor receptor superfamily member 1B-like isoform X2 [Myxocyprinus asiaticus]
MILSIRIIIFLAALWLLSEGKTSLPYKSDGDCINSTSEYFNKLLRICCSKCKPGTRQHVECTTESDTICAPCEDGQYSDNMNHFGNCFSCKKCYDNKGLKYTTKCSADTKSVCECKHGMFCYRHDFNGECEECRKFKSCKPGEGVIKNGTSKSNVKCAPCSKGTFSNRTNTEPCKPHTRCVGSSVLISGTSTTDTKCDTTPSTTTKVPPQISPNGFLDNPQQLKPRGIQSFTQPMNPTFTPSLPVLSGVAASTTRISSNLVSVRPTSNPEQYTMTIIYVITGSMLGLLMLTVIVIICRFRNRKGVKKAVIIENNKQEQGSLANCRPDCQFLLPVDGCQKEPSVTSLDSQSQPDSNQSHSSNDWLEGASQEETLPEQPSVSSPLVNLSITATFNCQMTPTCCSIPLSPATLIPKAEAPVRLSQEEVCISCQQEDGKEALQSVQESGSCVFGMVDSKLA